MPTCRFKDNSGSNKRKATIKDAQETFVLHLININNYEAKLEEITAKYYNSELTIQPFLICVGHTLNSVTDYYVHFDKILYKFDSFLHALDFCFKLFHVLHLEYPKACQGPWTFIQKYIYEISTDSDSTSSNISSLINFLSSVEN